MANGDLVYRITYPNTTERESDSNTENEEVSFFSKDGGKLPVVILFGWGGCKDKHLAKYSSIYEKNGCITVRCTTSLRVLTYRLDKLPKLAKVILDLLYEKLLVEHPIILHILSNGGSYLYHEISLEMQRRNIMLPIKGVIYDSGPHIRNFYNLYQTCKAAIRGPIFYNVPASFFVALAVMICYVLWTWIKPSGKGKGPKDIGFTLDEEPYKWPQMFIYSKSDEVSPWKEIEMFSQRREEKGVAVTRHCFENSPHVQHLLAHREVYINTIFNFMQTCLHNSQNIT